MTLLIYAFTFISAIICYAVIRLIEKRKERHARMQNEAATIRLVSARSQNTIETITLDQTLPCNCGCGGDGSWDDLVNAKGN